MTITAIIVNYRTRDLLSSIIDQLDKEELIGQIIVADNSNELSNIDESMLTAKLTLLSNNENLGFGKAVNQALSETDSRYILLVNPDVRLGEGCISILNDAIRTYGAAAVGPRFYMDDTKMFQIPPALGGSLWGDFAYMAAEKYPLDETLFTFNWILRHERFWSAEKPFWEPFLSGALVLVDREQLAFDSGALFDERFFLYFEDTDLCIRAIGKKTPLLCVPDAWCVHYYDQAPSPGVSKFQLMMESKVRFNRKYYGFNFLNPLNACIGPIENAANTDEALSSSEKLHKESAFSMQPMDDLGFLEASPYLEWQSPGSGKTVYFDIGVNAILVPFVRTTVFEQHFTIPKEIWEKITPGAYFARVFHPAFGVLKVWRWTK